MKPSEVLRKNSNGSWSSQLSWWPQLSTSVASCSFHPSGAWPIPLLPVKMLLQLEEPMPHPLYAWTCSPPSLPEWFMVLLNLPPKSSPDGPLLVGTTPPGVTPKRLSAQSQLSLLLLADFGVVLPLVWSQSIIPLTLTPQLRKSLNPVRPVLPPTSSTDLLLDMSPSFFHPSSLLRSLILPRRLLVCLELVSLHLVCSVLYLLD